MSPPLPIPPAVLERLGNIESCAAGIIEGVGCDAVGEARAALVRLAKATTVDEVRQVARRLKEATCAPATIEAQPCHGLYHVRWCGRELSRALKS